MGAELLMPVRVGAVLDAADIENPVVLDEPEGDAIVPPSRDPPTFQLEPQRLGQALRVARQCGSDELRDGRSHLVW